MTHEPSQKDSKMWIAQKIYVCKITGERCEKKSGRAQMTDQGPVCEDCELYQDWMEKISGGKS